MLDWSDKYATYIPAVDKQHKELAAALVKLHAMFAFGETDEEQVDLSLDRLIHSAGQHFIDEEKMMLKSELDERHLSMHHKEHKLFMTDIDGMRAQFTGENRIEQIFEHLVPYFSSWLTYHILGIDQVMTAQVSAIEKGSTPAEAFHSHRTAPHDSTQTHLLLEAVITLWKEARIRCHQLEIQRLSNT